MKSKQGWKPIPISLKVLFIIFILWTIGSIFAIPSRYELGLPFFGIYLYGILASLVVIILDIIAPIIFLYTLWKRKGWGIKFAYSYIGIFILNSIVAIFTFKEQLGFMPIFIPLVFNIIFLTVIYSNRNYFN